MTLLDDLRAFVEIETPSHEPGRVTALARVLADRLAAAGAATALVPCAGFGDALRATLRGPGVSGGTLLVGHLDTVWPAGTLAERPFRIDGKRASGPGVFDMKSGIAVAVAVMAESSALSPRPRLSLFLAPDEEVGSAGSREALVAFAREHDRVLVLEPSRAGAAKTSRKGTGLVTADFRGRAAHAGLEPEKGASALAEMARYVLFLSELGDARAGTTVTPTIASAGGASNVVPETARVVADVRVWTAGEERRIREALGRYAPADPRVAVETTARFDRPPMEETDASRALFETMRGIAAELGGDLTGERVGGASDGNLTAAAGVPTLDGLGPSGAGAHARDEWVDLDDLPYRVALLSRFVREHP